jgi:hypothetical protein
VVVGLYCTFCGAVISSLLRRLVRFGNALTWTFLIKRIVFGNVENDTIEVLVASPTPVSAQKGQTFWASERGAVRVFDRERNATTRDMTASLVPVDAPDCGR